MLTRTSSARFSARTQTSPEGLTSSSLRSVEREALWPWKTATRLHFLLPPTVEHCLVVPLSEDDFLRLVVVLFESERAAALAFGAASAQPLPEATTRHAATSGA